MKHSIVTHNNLLDFMSLGIVVTFVKLLKWQSFISLYKRIRLLGKIVR
jgi:hypothetical protein